MVTPNGQRAWATVWAMSATPPPDREVRASFDHDTIRLYQAFSPHIADPALTAQKFVPPFKLGRMTWVKPSLLWMAYRSDWARRPGQERVLAVDMLRAGFDEALAGATLSHFDPTVHGSREEWASSVKSSDVRVQWDPERSVDLTPQPWRTIQVGFSGRAARRYVDEWVVRLTDVTDVLSAINRLVGQGLYAEARELLPSETTYPASPEARARIGERSTMCQARSSSTVRDEAPDARSSQVRAAMGAGHPGTSTVTRTSASGPSITPSSHQNH